MRFTVHERVGAQEIDAAIENVVVAGWTGRDRASVAKHIAELAALGVVPPASTPCYYRVGRDLLTQGETLQVIGSDSSGEVEFVLVALGEGLFVGVGSDHTDRKVEAYNVTVSKQMCPKAIGRELWRFDEVADHWDALRLRSWSTKDGTRRLYQEGTVAAMKDPRELMDGYGGLRPGTVMYCGTLAAYGGVECGERFEVELEDPGLGRRLRHAYALEALPNLG